MTNIERDIISYGCSIISEGCLTDDHLLPRFRSALEDLGVPCDGIGDIDKLFDMLEEHAPVGTWFGAHAGDGALFGFWREEEGPQTHNPGFEKIWSVERA